MEANQTQYSSFEQRSVIKFGGGGRRNANHMQFTEECEMFTEMRVLVKENVYK